MTDLTIRPFEVRVPDQDLADLQPRNTRSGRRTGAPAISRWRGDPERSPRSGQVRVAGGAAR